MTARRVTILAPDRSLSDRRTPARHLTRAALAGALLAGLVMPLAGCPDSADSLRFRSYTRDDGSAPEQFQPTESDGQGAGGY